MRELVQVKRHRRSWCPPGGTAQGHALIKHAAEIGTAKHMGVEMLFDPKDLPKS